MIRVKRTYDPPARGDGRRILVERLWPRGLRKEEHALDAWVKEVAPSTALRRWFDEVNGAGLIPVELIRWELTGSGDDLPAAE